jgi:hypothetical protein
MNRAEMPSQNTSEPWVFAYARRSETSKRANSSKRDAPTGNGKWLVYVPERVVDSVWREYAAATEEGRLGSACKCSTVMCKDDSKQPNTYVIVVYTLDREDELLRVLRALRTELRVKQTLSYKTNAATLANEYGQGVAKYVSPAGSLDMELRRT